MKALKVEKRLKIKLSELKQYLKELASTMKNIKYLDWNS